MEPLREEELSFRLQHQHDDGSWGTFEPTAPHHSPTDHDPEREWGKGTIYKCTSCDEQLLVSPLGDLRPSRG